MVLNVFDMFASCMDLWVGVRAGGRAGGWWGWGGVGGPNRLGGAGGVGRARWDGVGRGG